MDIGCLLGALSLVVVLRTVFVFGAVFRDGQVVIAGNDPYLYVYWVEFLFENGFSAFDPGSLAQFPGALATHDVLVVLSAWLPAAVLGGTPAVARAVLAWYPVVAAVVVGLFVYLIALRVTADRRIGVAAVALFAVTPEVGYRMMLGFADHDALDLVWLGLSALALSHLSTRRRPHLQDIDRASVFTAAILGIGIAGQLMTWRGSPLYVAPLGLFVFAVVLSALRSDRSPAALLVLLLGALGTASILTVGVHLVVGWFSVYRVVTPVLFVGTAVLTAFARLVRDRNLDLGPATGALIGAGTAGIVGIWLFVPPLSAGLTEFVDYMAAYTWGNIIETQSILSGQLGTVMGPIVIDGRRIVDRRDGIEYEGVIW